MISFRATPPDGIDWDTASFSGENEELLAHLFAKMLEDAGWTLLAARDGGDFEEGDE